MKTFIAICGFVLYTCVILWEGYNYGHNQKASPPQKVCKVVKEKPDNCASVAAEFSEKIRILKIQKEQCEEELEECELEQ